MGTVGYDKDSHIVLAYRQEYINEANYNDYKIRYDTDDLCVL